MEVMMICFGVAAFLIGAGLALLRVGAFLLALDIVRSDKLPSGGDEVIGTTTPRDPSKPQEFHPNPRRTMRH